MKSFIAVTILTIIVNALCIWDVWHTEKVFKHMNSESSAIHQALLVEDITDPALATRINELDKYWTKKMDILCVSISRKDLQPVSDHIQFLKSCVSNDDQDTAVTYSLLLKYNVEGLKEISGFSLINIL
ncbi:MAG: DUF4363 family protein [Clostridia bacterium]|nr:DUF4363 family protein [Clostridia bacterium]